MIDNLLGDDDDDEIADESDDEEMGGLFDDPGDGGMDGGMDGDDDDLMGGGDDLMGDDEMSFGDGDDEGTTNSEMNNRIDELENEVASLSSSVNTVKSENEQISESLDDVEENIRKLLEVYEMVTRGVNPFVNENELGDAFGGGGGGGGGGSMGLFGGDEQQEEASSDIDESVANADADDFFDDDLDDDLDDGDDFDDDLDEGDDFDDGEDLADDGFDESFDDGDEFEDDGLDESFEDDEGGDSGGGKSFEELKSEYESGDAEWEDGEGDGDEDAADADDAVDDPLGQGSGLDETGDDVAAVAADADDAESEFDGAVDDDPVDEPGTASAVAGEKPYLQELPGGYVADVVVMDWLEFLVDEGGVDGAARTIAYYEAIDWVSATAAERLQTYLQGFGDDVADDPEPRSWLTVSHHETSLRFISRIDDPSMELLAFDEWGGQPFRGETRGGDPPGRVRPEPGVGAPGTQSAHVDYELESDGGHRTPADDGRSRYEPAATRRQRGGYRGENDDDAADEVGYGGFVWNDGGR